MECLAIQIYFSSVSPPSSKLSFFFPSPFFLIYIHSHAHSQITLLTPRTHDGLMIDPELIARSSAIVRSCHESFRIRGRQNIGMVEVEVEHLSTSCKRARDVGYLNCVLFEEGSGRPEKFKLEACRQIGPCCKAKRWPGKPDTLPVVSGRFCRPHTKRL